MSNDMLYVKVSLLVDGTGAPPLDDGAVLIRDGRLVEVGPSAGVARPDGAEVVQFDGQTLLPGLVDCHSHTTFRGDGSTIEETVEDPGELLVLLAAQNTQLALESGVTTLRDNGGRGTTTFAIREGIRRGYIQGPRLLISGRPITVNRGHCWPLGGQAEGADAVRRSVRELAEEGADWIKVMASGGGTKGTDPRQPSYTTEELKAVVQEAHAQDKLVGAHCSCTAAMIRLLDAGADMIIHANFYDSDGTYRFDPAVAARIADTGTWVNPTLHVCRSRIWRLRQLAETRGLTEGERAKLVDQERYWTELSDTFQRLRQAGVRLAAGSDSGWSYFSFGQFAHEVDAMVEAGAAPAEALASATRLSAEAIGVADQVGTLEVGKAADLLVVDGNPIEDIRALTRVVAVYKDGRRVH
jgi:imidazolonepropionase-like amidohydrolase